MILKIYSTYAVLLRGFEELGTFKITNMGFLGMLPGLHNSWLQIQVVTPPSSWNMLSGGESGWPASWEEAGGFLAFQGLVICDTL